MTLSFLFWQRWLFWSCILFIFVGAAIVLLGITSVLQIYYRELSNILYGRSSLPTDAEIFIGFIVGPFGGTMIACYGLAAFITYHAFKLRQIWARNAIAYCFLMWALVDSIVCIKMGVYFQVYLLNGFSILVKLLPLIFTWNCFKTNHLPVSE